MIRSEDEKETKKPKIEKPPPPEPESEDFADGWKPDKTEYPAPNLLGP